jgi:hypothetical protein
MSSAADFIKYQQEAARKQAAHNAMLAQNKAAMRDPINAMSGAYIAPQPTRVSPMGTTIDPNAFHIEPFRAEAPVQTAEPPVNYDYNFGGRPMVAPKQIRSARDYMMAEAQKPDPGLQVGPVENFVENVTDAKQSFLSGVGMLGDQVGWVAGQVDRAFGGDGQNAVKEAAYKISRNAQGVNDYENLERTDTQGDFQKWVAPAFQQMPNAALAMGTGGMLGALQWALGEGAGEAGRYEQEQLAKGRDPDIVNWNSQLVNLGNAAISGPIGLATNPVTGALPGVAGAVARSVEEGGEEAWQPGLQEAMDVDRPLGVVEAFGRTMDNLFNRDTGKFAQNFADEGLGAMASTAIMSALLPGGGGNASNQTTDSDTSPDTGGATPVRQPTLQEAVSTALGTQAAGQQDRTNIGSPVRSAADWQAANAEQPVATTQPTASVEAPTAQGEVPTGINTPPVSANRNDLLARAEAELTRLTENPQMDEEGYATEEMQQGDTEKFTRINAAVQQKDWATLTNLLESDDAASLKPMVYGEQAVRTAQGLPRAFYDRYLNAKRMQSAGAESRAIQDATGFWIGPDNKLRFEGSDDRAQINIPLNGLNKRPLNRVMDNPDFFNFYPEAVNKPVIMIDDETVAGRNVPGGNLEISRPVAREMDDDFNQETLLHEVQHGVQFREGFAPGANAEYMATVPVSQVGNNIVNKARDMINAWDVQVQEDADRQAEAGRRYKVPKDPKNVVEARKIVKQFEDRYNAMTGHERYMMLQGEIEARQTGNRRKMTQAERDANPIRPNPFALVINRDYYTPNSAFSTEGVNQSPETDSDSMGTMGDLFGGFKAQELYTGSPAKFEGNLNSDFRGSGQQAAIHGDGHYLTEDDTVGAKYATTYGGYSYQLDGQPVQPGSTEEQVIQAAVDWGEINSFERDRPQNAQEAINPPMKELLENYAEAGYNQAFRPIAADLANRNIQLTPKGQLAVFDVPDAATMVQEYSKVSEQTPEVQQALQDMANPNNQVGTARNTEQAQMDAWINGPEAKGIVQDAIAKDLTDSQLFKKLESAATKALKHLGPRAVSRMYSQNGIKGRAYAGEAAWSKTGEPVQNRVIFDDATAQRTRTVFQELDTGGVNNENARGRNSNDSRRVEDDGLELWNSRDPKRRTAESTTEAERNRTSTKEYIAGINAGADTKTPFAPEDLIPLETKEVSDAALKLFKDSGVNEADAQVNANIIAKTVEYIAKQTGQKPMDVWKKQGLKFVKRGEGLTLTGEFDKETAKSGPMIAGLQGRSPMNTGGIWLDTELQTPITFIHEVTHYFEDLFRQAARDNKDNEQLQKDWDAILEAGHKSTARDAWDRYASLSGDQAELFGNSLVDYFRTGKAPARLKNLYSRLKHWFKIAISLTPARHRAQLPEATREFWDRVMAFDEAFEQEYSEDTFIEKSLESNLEAEGFKKEQLPAKTETKGDYTLTTQQKGNIAVTTKKQNNTGLITAYEKYLASPSLMADRFAKFKAYFDMGVFARREQDRMRADWQHRIDKVLGGRNMFGLRTKGIVTTDEERETLQDAMTIGDMMGKELTPEDLREMGANDNVIKAYKTMRTIYSKIADALDRQRTKSGLPPIERIDGYVPHFFSDYRVAEIGEDGSVNILDSFKTMREAEKFAKSLDKSRNLSIRPVINDFSGQAKTDAITVGDMQYFAIMNKLSDVFALSREDARAFGGDVVRMANKGRFLGNAKHREGYDGYNKDMEYQIRHMANLAARYVAMDELKRNSRRLFERQYGKWGNQYEGIGAYTKAYIKSVLGEPSEAEKLWNYTFSKLGVDKWLPAHYQDRPALTAFNALKSVNAVAKLALGNVSSALMNYTSIVHVNAITDTATTAAAITEYLDPRKSMTKQKLYSALGLRSDITQDQVSTYSRSNAYIGAVRKGVGKLSGGLFQYADGSARKIAAIAGYRYGLKKGMSQQEAIKYARDIVDKTNFNYGVEDAPGAFRSGPVLDSVMQFRKYGIKSLELGLHHLEGFQKVKYWGGILLLAGIPGAIPGWEFLSAFLKSLFPERDLTLELKSVLDKAPIPTALKRTIAYGAASNLGFDISRRSGFSDIIPSSWQDVPGAAFSAGTDMIKSVAAVATGGDILEEIKGFVPGLSNIALAITGEAQNTRGKTSFETETLGETLFGGMGLRPIRRSVEADAMAIANLQQRQDAAARTEAIKAYLADKSPENRKALRDVGATVQQVKNAVKSGRGTTMDQAVQRAVSGRNRDAYETLTNYMQ